jgi:hypothetical protein
MEQNLKSISKLVLENMNHFFEFLMTLKIYIFIAR